MEKPKTQSEEEVYVTSGKILIAEGIKGLAKNEEVNTWTRVDYVGE